MSAAEARSPIRCLIVDDERPARLHLRSLLAESGVDVVGECGSASEVIAAIQGLRPDVVFLDVRMPGLSGIELARALAGLKHRPLMVFVTGFEEYAVSAFEVDAVDYLVKPLDRARLLQCVARIQERLAAQPSLPEVAPPSGSLPQPIPVRGIYSIRLIPPDEILIARTQGGRVVLCTRTEQIPTSWSLRELAKRLPADRFARVHESAIVSLGAIRQIHILGGETYELEVAGIEQPIPLSRSRARQLRERLGW